MNKIEQVRDALESVKRSIAFDVQDWSTDKRLAWIYGIIMGWGDASDEVARKHRWTAEDVATMQRHRAAIAILKDMDGQEPVAWMNGLGNTKAAKFHDPSNPLGYDIPLYAHPSPSAPVDIAEIIKAGDVMHKAMVRYQMDVDDDPPMKHRDMMEAWTEATAKHRTT